MFGVAVLFMSYQYNVRFLDWLRFQSIGTRDYIVDKLSQMFYEVTPQRVLIAMVAGAVVPFLIIFLAFLPKVVPGLIFGLMAALICWKLPKPIVDALAERRVKQFNLQMVDALNLMANGMKSGLSVVQAIGIVIEQSPNPIAQEFNLVLAETKVGLSLEEALMNMSKRLPCDDVEMFVTSVIILKETGGNLAETFDTIVSTIRERIKIQSKIDAMTAQGFYQGMILLGVPPFICLYFTSSDPEFMAPLYESPIGWAALAFVVVLEVLAYFMIKKVMKIDV
jgi:tight adherence protein B